MASGRQVGGGGYSGGGGAIGGGGGRAKTNITKISNKKTMGKTEATIRVRTDKIQRSPAAQDMRKGNLDNLKKTFGKSNTTKKNNKATLTTRGKVVGTGIAVVGTTKGMKKAGEMNAARIRKNKAKSEPVPRDPRKQ